MILNKWCGLFLKEILKVSKMYERSLKIFFIDLVLSSLLLSFFIVFFALQSLIGCLIGLLIGKAIALILLMFYEKKKSNFKQLS